MTELGERPAIKKAIAMGPEFREDPASIAPEERVRRAKLLTHHRRRALAHEVDGIFQVPVTSAPRVGLKPEMGVAGRWDANTFGGKSDGLVRDAVSLHAPGD